MEARVVLSEGDLRLFERSATENARFWSRFPRIPDLRGASVLEVGCGRGRLCVDMATAGARRVLGLDILGTQLAFASENLRQNHSRYLSVVEFRQGNLPELDDDECFDFIVTKDALEHVIDLDGMLEAMRERLAPGGKIFAGFGPLYTSPYGDHDRRKRAFEHLGLKGKAAAMLPWAHLLLEKQILKEHSRLRGAEVANMQELCLNGLAIDDYRKAFVRNGLRVECGRQNQGPAPLSQALSLLAKVPLLERYCVFNAYLVLSRETPLSHEAVAEMEQVPLAM